MAEATFARETLVTFGAGIFALLLVFGITIYVVLKAPKFFAAWQEMVRCGDEERHTQLKTIAELNAVTVEVIRANTAAFVTGGQATENMAKALELLTAMYDRSSKEARDHDTRVQQMSLMVAQI